MSLMNEAINELRVQAEKELSFCDPIDTPYVCLMINSHQGREKVLHQIVELVGAMGVSISDAILQIETEANPNTSY